MKANKFFAAAMAALMVLGFNACKGNDPDAKLSLNKKTLTIQVDKESTLTATIQAEFSADNGDVVALTPANDGKSVKIKGLKEGKATITAKAGNQTATCAVTVSKDAPEPEEEVDYSVFKQLQGKEYYTFFLQDGASKYLGNKVLYYFGPNNHQDAALGKEQGSRWTYLWDNTFVGGTPVGTDPFDGGEGWFSIKQCVGGTWAGMGLCVAINDGNNESGENADEDLAALNSLKTKITNYEEWYLAVALKNTVQGAAYEFQLIGSNVKGGDGKGVESGKGTLTITPKATGEWDYQEFNLNDIPGLEFGEWTTNGANIFVILGTPYMSGVQLDLGYVFIYKK